MSEDQTKRRTLKYMVSALVGSGVIATSVPFCRSLNIASHKEAETTDFDISGLAEDEMMIVNISHMPIYIMKRSVSVLEELEIFNSDLLDPDSLESIQPEGAKNSYRSLRPDIFVANGVCTHLGCSVNHTPKGESEYFEEGVYFCPCHGAKYDLAGRVYKNNPAPRNLDIPEYEIIGDTVIRVKHASAF